MISISTAPVAPPDTSRIRILLVASWVLMIGGIVLLGYAGYVTTDTAVYQRVEVKKFESSTPVVKAHALIEGDIIGEMQVPRLGLKAIVVQGDSPGLLRQAVGHLAETALPGEAGNIVLAAHRDTFFRPLRHIRRGDIVTFDTPNKRFEYEVDSTRVVSPRESGIVWDSRNAN